MIAGAMQNARLQSGDDCPSECGGSLYVDISRDRGVVHVQYLRCNKCKQYPDGGKLIRNPAEIRRRKRT